MESKRIMTKEETAFRKRLEALPQMTNREAMEIVLDMANELRETCKVQREDVEMEAIYQMQDYMNDLMRLEE